MTGARPRLHVVGLIQRFDNRYLVRRPAPPALDAPNPLALDIAPDTVATSAATWDFPRGWATPEESAEAAMRRVGASLIGMPIEVDVGQPPLLAVVEGQRAELRYFFCGIAGSWRDVDPSAQLVWVDLAELAALPKHPIHQAVVAWLVEQG